MANYYDNNQPWSPGQPSSPDVQYPVDGYGGSLYLVPFKVPVYDPAESMIFKYLTWSVIDSFYQANVVSVLTSAIGFAICIVTLLNVIVITPPHKRRLPLYIFILLALFFRIFDELLVLMIFFHSPIVSAYAGLTLDTSSVVLSASHKAIYVLSIITTVLSFGLLQACLYIQGKSLLTWLKINHIRIYRVILVALVTAGFISIVLYIAFLVLQVIFLNRSMTATEHFWQRTIFKFQWTIGTISVCGWSFVNLSSSMIVLHKRKKVLLSKNKLYESTLNLITIVGLESFIIPIIFCCTQFISASAKIPFLQVQLVRLAVACILLLLPIGSLFPSIRNQEVINRGQISGATQNRNGSRHDLKKVETVQCHLPLNISELSNSPPSPRTELFRKAPLDPFEIELEAIDGLEDTLPNPEHVSEQKDGTDVDCIRTINTSNERIRLL